MEDQTSILKPEVYVEPARDALTTVTPDNGTQDDGNARHQLSDDANAHAAVPAGDAAVDNMYSPFADAPANDSDVVSSGDNHLYGLMDFNGSPSDASRQHHLLRHSLPSEQRGDNVLSHFGVETVSDAAKTIKKMSQRDLQAKFKAVYGTKTFSNNNNWLRRKLFEAIGLDPSKGAVKKPGAGTQRRRRPAKPSAPKVSMPRVARRSRADAEADHHSVAEALLALGELAGLAADGYDLDELEERFSAGARAEENGSGSDGRVPTSGNEDDAAGYSSEERDVLRASRGVPHVEVAPMEAEEEIPQAAAPATPVDVDSAAVAVAAQQEIVHNMGQMFDYMSRMQRQAMEAAGPHHAMAAMMAAHPHAATHAPPAMQMHMAIQMAAMSGNPHAANLLHSLMASGAMGAQAASPEVYQHMMQEMAVAASHQQHLVR